MFDNLKYLNPNTFDQARFALGTFVENAGNRLGVPETGISERIAGRDTPGTVKQASADEGVTQPNQPFNNGGGFGPLLDKVYANQSTGSGGSGGGSGAPTVYKDTPVGQTPPSANQLFDEAVNYFNQQYGDLMAGLDPQKAAQEAIVNNNFGQSISDIGSTLNQGKEELGQQANKVVQNTQKTLGDLTSNLRNQMTAGQVYLGARGAGDSSAGNQYSYALTRLGNQARGEVLGQQASILSEIDGRVAKLKNIFLQEQSNLETQKNNALQSIASWYSDAQNQIKMAKGQNIGQLSMQALQYAISEIQNVNNRIANQREALQSWALSNSQNLNQLKQNMAGVAQYSAPQIQSQPINGIPSYSGGTGSTGPAVGYGATQDQKDLYGNPIA